MRTGAATLCELRCELVRLDHRDPTVAARIHAVQMLAYAQEAALLELRHFPALERSVADVQGSAEDFLGAWSGLELLGLLSICKGEGSGAVTITSLVVSPTHQRQGIGSSLLAAALDECAGSTVCVATAARNAPALALYRRSGFVDYRRWAVGAEALELVELRRSPIGGGSVSIANCVVLPPG